MDVHSILLLCCPVAEVQFTPSGIQTKLFCNCSAEMTDQFADIVYDRLNLMSKLLERQRSKLAVWLSRVLPGWVQLH